HLAGTLADPPDRDDAAVPYAHVGPIPRQTGSVDHRAVLDHQVVGHSDLRASLALALGAIGDPDGFLLEVEAERLLALDVAAGDPDEERVVAVLDRMDVADREHRGAAGLVQELALQLELRVAGLAPVVEAAPPAHPRRVLVVAVDHPARTVVVRHGLA